MNISFRRHEASAEYRIRQKLGLEGRSGLFRGTSHFRDTGYPLCQRRQLVHSLLSVYPDSDASSPVAVQFKKAFEDAQGNNAKLAGAPPPYTPEEKCEGHTDESEDEDEDEGEVKGNAPAPSETNPPVGESQESEKKDEE
jgi:hypothetical protein